MSGKIKETISNGGVFKKAQLLTKKGISFHFFTTYFFINQCFTVVAFWLRFGCVSYVFGATVALFLKVAKNGATFWVSCAYFGTLAQPTQLFVYQLFKVKKMAFFYLGCAGCAKKIPYLLKRNHF